MWLTDSLEHIQQYVKFLMKKQIMTLVAGIFLSSVSFFIVMPLVPLMVARFEHQNDIEVWSGLVMGVSFFVSAIATPFWGTLATKYGARLMLLRASFGLCLTYFLTPFAVTLPQLFLLRCLNGLMAGFVPAALAMISASTEKGKLGKVMSFVTMAQAVGSLCGPAAGGFLSATFGIRITFFFASVMMFVAGTLSLVFLTEVKFAASSTVENMKESFKISLRHPGIMRPVIFTFCLIAISATFQPLIPLRIAKLTSNDADTALYLGIIYSMGGAASLLLGYAWGHATDLWGHKRILPLVVGGAALCAFSMTAAQSVLIFSVIFAVYSVFLCELSTLLNVNVAKSAPEDRLPQAFSLNHTGSQLGLAFGPVIGGLAAKNFGHQGAFAFTGTLFAIFALVLIFKVKMPPSFAKDPL